MKKAVVRNVESLTVEQHVVAPLAGIMIRAGQHDELIAMRIELRRAGDARCARALIFRRARSRRRAHLAAADDQRHDTDAGEPRAYGDVTRSAATDLLRG